MKEKIIQALQQIEKQYQVKILYACEAGSRAWGIESEDSDYDVRFIYLRIKNAYLNLDTPRDVIEHPGELLDISGWDIYKALRLLRKTNPSLLEWLFSPTIYIESSPIIQKMRDIARSSIAPRVPLFHHYLHMAKGNYIQYIEHSGESGVRTKKYLYVIRPLIMLLYLEQHNGEMPFTVSFPDTLAHVDLPVEIRAHINSLIERKQSGVELGLGEHDIVLDAFIDERLEQWLSQSFSDERNISIMLKATSKILENALSA